MIRSLLKKFTLVLGAGLVVATAGPAVTARAALFEGAVDEACKGTQLDVSDSANCEPKKTGERVTDILRLVLNIFSWVTGIIAIIMIIIGGLKYITSGGDSAGVNSAKNTLLYAVIGLVIVAMAQVLVRFVIKKANV